MKSLYLSLARFEKLSLRERLLAAMAMTAVLYFAADIVVLTPQHKAIRAFQERDKAHQTELTTLNMVLAGMESEAARAGDPNAKDRTLLAELKRQIAEADAFLGLSDAGAPQLGTLVRELGGASPRLTLVSLKTLPVTVLYGPGKEAPGSRKPGEFQKTIYQYGVEVSVKGAYFDLVSYLENLQKYPGRLFWSDARLDVPSYPEAVLKLVVYTLSDQPSLPLH